MIFRRHRILVLVALLLVATMALTACGGKKAAPTPQSPAQPASKFGGTLKIGTLTDPDTLNVLVSNSITTSWILDLIYPTLLTFNEKGEKVPYLAKEWKTSPDGKSVTYKLRDDMKWDDGKPVTSADVKYTAEVTMKETIGFNASLLKNVASIDTPDATTVTFNLKKPSAVFATSIGYWLKVVPSHIWSTVGENKKFTNDKPIGAGPFKLTKYEKGQYWELEPQGETWMAPEKKPYVEKIQFRVYPDMNTMILALKKGDIDAIANPIPPASVADLKATPGIQIGKTASLGYGHLTFNVQRPNAQALADKAVRQAIAKAVNKEAIRNIVLQGNGLAIATPVSPVLGDFYNPNVKDYEFNLEAAKKQLEDAGYKDQGGVRAGPKGKLEFTIIYDQGFDPMSKAVKMIADDLAKIGVKLNLQGMERNTYLAKAKALDFDIYAGKWGVMDEPADYLGLLFLSDNWQKGGINFSGINDPKLDAMIKDAQGAMEKKAMQEKLFAIQEYLHEQTPVITLWVETYNLAMSDKWAGWKIFPSDLRSFVDPMSLVGVYQVKK